MGKYYVSGYSTPEDVNSSDDVRRYQKMLGVKIDGIWGKNTQAAYEKYRGGKDSKSSGGFIAGNFDWDGASKEISDRLTQVLRPAVDAAIKERKQVLETNKAELDADAAARGMESSTFVSSVKNRENSYAQDDIANMEAGYQSNLSSTLYSALMSLYDSYTEQQNANAQLELEKEKLELEKKKYRQQAAAFKKGDSNDSSASPMPSSGYTYSDYYTFMQMLSDDQKTKLFESDEIYWKWMREQIKADLGEVGYYNLYDKFGMYESNKRKNNGAGNGNGAQGSRNYEQAQ